MKMACTGLWLNWKLLMDNDLFRVRSSEKQVSDDLSVGIVKSRHGDFGLSPGRL